MLYIILLVSLVIFFTFGSIMGVIQTKRMLQMDLDERIRLDFYATVTFSMWIPVIAVLTVVGFSDTAFADIGFSLFVFDYNIVFTVVVLIVVFMWAAFSLYRIAAFLFSAKHRKRRYEIMQKKANSNNYYDLVEAKLMTPKTKREKRWWLGISLTTGICEEIIFRGVFIYLIASIFPYLSIFLVFVIAVALFGLGHFYQGAKGLILTTLAGAFLALAYIVSGSLIPVIVVHFINNFAMAFEYSDRENVVIDKLALSKEIEKKGIA